MQRIAMLGSGFIGRFYADSLHGKRSKDKIISCVVEWEPLKIDFVIDIFHIQIRGLILTKLVGKSLPEKILGGEVKHL